MKKFISYILMVAIFLSLFTMVTFAEIDPPNLVADYRFSADAQGWYVFNGTSGLTHQDGYISANNEGKSWVSPAVDIYNIIKEAGTGTYTVNARIYIAFDPGHEVNARMMLRTDKAYSFSINHSGNYYGAIGTLTYCEPCTWTNMSGSFKVLESDIQNSSGDFILCFDSLFDLEEYNVFVDDVKICKLSEDDITNGDFSYDTVGWRNWGGKGNFTVEYGYDGILGSIFKAHYLKASTYGSIVTNVDQIIAKYGCTKYKLSFKIKVEEDYLDNLDKIRFFLARNNGDYNYWVGMTDATTLEDSNWVTFEKIIDMATMVEEEQTLYDVLAPYQNQVFLRYDYVDAEGVSYDEEHSYYITDVSFKPVITAECIVLEKTTMEVEKGWDGNNPVTVYPINTTNKALYWTSNNSDVATVERNTGFIVARNAGTATITAHLVNGTQKASFIIKVKDSVLIRRDSEGLLEVVLGVTETGEERIWKCIDEDVVFYEQYGENPAYDFEHDRRLQRCEYNYYEHIISIHERYGQKEYSDAELKLLYLIDPYGVAKYVQMHAENTETTVEDRVQYKDEIFRLLFRRNPKYFARTISGEWYQVTSYTEINDVLSESEMYFGMHPIYDLYTRIALLNAFASVFTIIFGEFPFSITFNTIVNIGLIFASGLEAVLKDDITGFAGDVAMDIIRDNIQNVATNWAFTCVSLYGTLQDLSDAFTVNLDYNKQILNFCAYDNEISVKFKMQDGTIHNLKDVCELFN